MPQVEYRAIEDFPGWEVNELGEVFHIKTGRAMAINQNQRGLAIVKMMRDGRQMTRQLSLLVARAFLPPPQSDYWTTVIHLNGDRMDCRAMNLAWRTRGYALRYQAMFNDEPYRVAVYVPQLDRMFPSLREFCTTFGVYERSAYIDLCNGEPCDIHMLYLERYVE